jgi:seryl-tRNA synthetase
MSDQRDRLRALVERLETERDELKMKMGLAKLEAKEEWQELEQKLDRLRGRLRRAREEADDASDDIGDALEILGDEIKEGFARIRNVF